MATALGYYHATRAAADTRAEDAPPDQAPDAAPLNTLTTKQRSMLIIIERYCEATGEACPGSYLARRLSLHHSTVREHVAVLFRKGWLRSPNVPAVLRGALDQL